VFLLPIDGRSLWPSTRAHQEWPGRVCFCGPGWGVCSRNGAATCAAVSRGGCAGTVAPAIPANLLPAAGAAVRRPSGCSFVGLVVPSWFRLFGPIAPSPYRAPLRGLNAPMGPRGPGRHKKLAQTQGFTAPQKAGARLHVGLQNNRRVCTSSPNKERAAPPSVFNTFSVRAIRELS